MSQLAMVMVIVISTYPNIAIVLSFSHTKLMKLMPFFSKPVTNMYTNREMSMYRYVHLQIQGHRLIEIFLKKTKYYVDEYEKSPSLTVFH